MTEPCVQGERLATLETILEQMAETLTEQKQLGIRTYEVLASISLQGQQIKSLIATTDQIHKDLEEAFGRLRIIEHRHDIETGMTEADIRWRSAGLWFLEKLSIPIMVTLFLLLWAGDKFQWFTRALATWKEFKG